MENNAGSTLWAWALPTDNSHLCNVISGHAHKATKWCPSWNQVARPAYNSRFWLLLSHKKLLYRGSVHYKIELIYVLTKVRAWGSVKLGYLTLIKKKKRKIFQFLLPPGLQLDNTFQGCFWSCWIGNQTKMKSMWCWRLISLPGLSF